jgi:hypothetical protein
VRAQTAWRARTQGEQGLRGTRGTSGVAGVAGTAGAAGNAAVCALVGATMLGGSVSALLHVGDDGTCALLEARKRAVPLSVQFDNNNAHGLLTFKRLLVRVLSSLDKHRRVGARVDVTRVPTRQHRWRDRHEEYAMVLLLQVITLLIVRA